MRASVMCGTAGLLASACGLDDRPDETTPGFDVAREDSAGVELIHISRDVIDGLPEWSIGPEPLLRIGDTGSDPDQLFGRVLAAVRLGSGDMVVVDGHSLDFHLFSNRGEFIRRFGGTGAGPGEFGGVGKVRRLDGDRIGVLDERLRRVSVFDPNGSLFRTRPFPCAPGAPVPPSEPGPCYAADILDDGTVLSYATRRDGPTPMPIPDQFQEEPPGTYLLALATDDVIEVVDSARAAGRARIVVERGGSRAVWTTKELFAPEGHWTATRSGLVVGAGDRYELRYLARDGRLERVVRVTGGLERSTRTHNERISRWAGTITSSLALELTQRYLENVEIDRPIPPFGELRDGGEGRIWAAEYFPPSPLGPQEPVRWTVFSEAGVPVARIETGTARDILDIGPDYLILRETGPLNEEHVALYPILREAPGPGP